MITTDTKNELGITVAKDLRAVIQGKVGIVGEASYGSNAERLIAAKKRFDQDDIFSSATPLRIR